jgi:hypothetical protein
MRMTPMLDDLTKSNVPTLLALAVTAIVLPELVPSLRPAVKSAVKIGLALLTESEAEAELIESLVSTTAEQIKRELSEPLPEAERRHAVRQRIRRFQRKARARSQRWGKGHEGREHSYRRHVAKLNAALSEEKQQVGPAGKAIIDDATAALVRYDFE